MCARIVELRTELSARGLDAGLATLAWHLGREGLPAPSTSTIRRILHAAGLVVPEPSRAVLGRLGLPRRDPGVGGRLGRPATDEPVPGGVAVGPIDAFGSGSSGHLVSLRYGVRRLGCQQFT